MLGNGCFLYILKTGYIYTKFSHTALILFSHSWENKLNGSFC